MSPVYIFLAIILCHSVAIQDAECCNPAHDGKWLNGRMRKMPVATKDEESEIEIKKPGHPLNFLLQKFGFMTTEFFASGKEIVGNKNGTETTN